MTSPRIFWFGALVFLLVLIYLLKPILMPFLVAMILAYLGDPLVDRLESLRINRMLAVTMVFVGFGLVVVLGVLVLVRSSCESWLHSCVVSPNSSSGFRIRRALCW